MEVIGPNGKTGPFSRSNEHNAGNPPLEFANFRVLESMDLLVNRIPNVNRPIFKVKQSPERVNPSIFEFSCAIVHASFGDLDFRCHFCKNNSWTSIKTLVMELVGLDGQTGLFSRSNNPLSG
ncbi:hypothetical protein H5410_056526 [Solanum commersonii]|uniref:Uncharacterized protein n=1 Tax=Solanum commersonii TaxID=4109 RepID=A0A9J5WMX7_SOLCO|nr:hypothetical protein H5410_056526 [Solanum commersonii]